MSRVAKTTPDVSTPNSAYSEMVEAAALPRTLMGGTVAMRAAGREYLPQEQAESDTAYQARLQRSFLFNAYGQAVDNLVGRVFRNGVMMKDLPSVIEELTTDVDGTGRNLERFLRDLLEDAMHPGVAYLLVDFPGEEDAPGEAGDEPPVRTVADEKAMGLRPYWIHIPQQNLINWRTKVVDGVETLTRVQIMECVNEPINEWGDESICQVKVLYPGAWEIWRQNANKEWEIYKQGTTTLDFIPLLPVYTRRTGFMTGRPLLANLAETNLCHWQSYSDQRNLLHVARVPILFGAGFGDNNAKIEIGGSRMIKNSGPPSKLMYVEHTGQAIGAGQTDLDKLETKMAAQAMEPMLPKTGNVTATATAIDEAASSSNLQTISNGLADCVQTAFTFMLEWMAQPDTESGTVELDCDTLLTPSETQDLDALKFARTNGDLSRNGYLLELKRRDILNSEFDIEEDAEYREEEGPSLGALGVGDVKGKLQGKKGDSLGDKGPKDPAGDKGDE